MMLQLPYRLGEIHVGKGVMIGMEALIMSGVAIGEGAIIGAFFSDKKHSNLDYIYWVTVYKGSKRNIR